MKPFETEYGYAIIHNGKWIEFPTYNEAWEYYYEEVICSN